MRQHVRHRLDFGMLIGERFGNPPPLDSAIRQDGPRVNHQPVGKRLFQRRTGGVHPDFRDDLGLAGLDHRCDGGDGRGRDDLHLAAVARFENKSFDRGSDLRGPPVHLADRHAAGLGRTHRRAAKDQCAVEKFVHRLLLLVGLARSGRRSVPSRPVPGRTLTETGCVSIWLSGLAAPCAATRCEFAYCPGAEFAETCVGRLDAPDLLQRAATRHESRNTRPCPNATAPPSRSAVWRYSRQWPAPDRSMLRRGCWA